MSSRTTSFAVLGLLAAVLIATLHLAAQPRAESPVAVRMYPRERPDGLLWPTDSSWVWSITRLDPLAKGESLSLVARVVHQQLKKGEAPAIASRMISKADAETELPTGKVSGGKGATLVSVQMIDLAVISASPDKTPLRLLLNLSVGGATVRRAGKAVIDGDRILALAVHPEYTWRDGELHLQNVFVQDGDRVAIYDIVLIHSE